MSKSINQLPISQIPINHIEIKDDFWGKYMELVRNKVIPYQWEALNDRVTGAEPSHCIHNFLVASGKVEGKFEGFVFQDSDLYKWLEAVAYVLMWRPDKELEVIADDAIRLMADAQQEDGYLDTYYIINGLDKRFTNLQDNHELYCLGHMLEAAVAYYEATGKRQFLDIAARYADCAANEFGLEEGKKHGYPGHEIAEMALVKLYKLTNAPKHLALAQYFINERGKAPLYFAEESIKEGRGAAWEESYFGYQYFQAAKPVREQLEAEGHAVRAVYLYSGMADVARETNDTELFRVCETLWEDITKKKIYITGAIGANEYGESFSFAYDLPNDTIYGETCAAIGLIFFAKRMFEITRDSKYIDVMERALYNGVISGMSLDGTAFFYVNPLEVLPEACEKDWHKKHVKAERQKWFGCACCPPNVARTLSSIANYAYESDENTLYMNLFIGGDIKTTVGGREVALNVQTSYPWEQNIDITFAKEIENTFNLAIRIPAWCKQYSITINGEPVLTDLQLGYVFLTKTWEIGDKVQVILEMPVTRVLANPKVREDIGKAALMRGPLVYCLEEVDNGSELHKIYLDKSPDFTVSYESEILGGVVTIEAKGQKISQINWSQGDLYQAYEEISYDSQVLKFVPYYAWSNRGKGEMLVWVHVNGL